MRFTSLFPWFTGASPSRWVVVGFFITVLLIGLTLFRDYGISWDEPVDHYNGVVNTSYIAQRLHLPFFAKGLQQYPDIPQLENYLERDHGPAFEYPVVMLTMLLGFDQDTQTMYYLRHLLVFLVSFGGLIAFYKLAAHRFHDWRLALLAAGWLLVTPRLFAERFYNTKDAIFLSLFTIAMYTLVRLLRAPSWQRGLWHGVACGVAIGLRVNGILLLPLTLAGLALIASTAPPAQRRQLLTDILLWLSATAATAILLWPWLWNAPLANISKAFENLSHFRWDGIVLYRGDLLPAMQLPWHYTFVWIGLTTPVAYLAAFGLGLLVFLSKTLRSFSYVWRTEAGRLDLLFLAWLTGPLLAVVLFHSVLYDGWRHLYFVYPALLLFAVSAVQWLLDWARAARIRLLRVLATLLLILLALGSLEPLWRIVRDHPHQQVYFNNLISAPEIEAGFERDYWGLSYRQGLEWILRNDPAPQIKVATERNVVIENNLLILSPADRARLMIVAPEEATYFLGMYRWHPEPYMGYGWEVHTEYSNGVKVLSIYKQ